MFKIFIYYEEQDKWVEERSHLLYHDLAVFIDEDSKVIYLWSGPKCTRERSKKGSEALNSIIETYTEKSFQVKNLNKKIPTRIKSVLKNLLEITEKEQQLQEYQYSHFITIRLHFILSIICLILPIFAILILGSSLFWDSIGTAYLINAIYYNNWLSSANIFNLVCLILFIPQLIISIYEYEKSIIVFSSISIIICISLLLFLQQGIFLFQFQEISTPNLYYINKIDLYLFLLLISSSILLFEIPNTIKTISFLRIYKKFIF